MSPEGGQNLLCCSTLVRTHTPTHPSPPTLIPLSAPLLSRGARDPRRGSRADGARCGRTAGAPARHTGPERRAPSLRPLSRCPGLTPWLPTFFFACLSGVAEETYASADTRTVGDPPGPVQPGPARPVYLDPDARD